MSKRAVLLVGTNPASEEQSDEYNAWYNDTHIPQMIERVPGFLSARRFEAHGASPVQPDQRYLAIYEVEVDNDPAEALAALNEAVQGGKIDTSPALSPDATLTLYSAL
jgi:hypothetical protein